MSLTLSLSPINALAPGVLGRVALLLVSIVVAFSMEPFGLVISKATVASSETYVYEAQGPSQDMPVSFVDSRPPIGARFSSVECAPASADAKGASNARFANSVRCTFNFPMGRREAQKADSKGRYFGTSAYMHTQVPKAMRTTSLYGAFAFSSKEFVERSSVSPRYIALGVQIAIGVMLAWWAGYFRFANTSVQADQKSPLSMSNLAYVTLVPGLFLVFLALRNGLNPANFRLDIETEYLPALIQNAILAPIAEELIFRVWMLTALSVAIGRTGAIFVGSLLFSLSHQADPLNTVLYFLYGLGFSWLWTRTKSLWLCVASHCLLNLAILIFA